LNKLQREAAANTPADYKERIAMVHGNRFAWDTKLTLEFSDGRDQLEYIIFPHWERKFEKIEESGDCKIFKAPDLNPIKDLVSVKIGKKRFNLLDFHKFTWGGIVSEKLKLFLEGMDGGWYQFTPIKFLDWKDEPLSEEQYYHMVVKRYVDFPSLDADVRQQDLPGLNATGFVLQPLEKKLYNSIKSQPKVYEILVNLNLWFPCAGRSPVLLSPKFLESIRELKITGFDVKTLNCDELKGGTVVYV
jgi:hypothetical protein